MMKVHVWIVTLAVFAAPAAKATIVVDHSANRTGGGPSDTAAGDAWSQLIADDVILETAATIQHVSWWGLYYYDAVPITETIRIRFYDARPSDGLPGTVLSEQGLLNPSRAATGVIIPNVPGGTGFTAAEYRFDTDLPTPISLNAHTHYWMEIVQDGNSDSIFGWRGADIEHTGIAFINPNYQDWVLQSGPDMAFQLSTIPEPAALALIILGVSLSLRRGGLRTR